jgi:hypothetical protein
MFGLFAKGMLTSNCLCLTQVFGGETLLVEYNEICDKAGDTMISGS